MEQYRSLRVTPEILHPVEAIYGSRGATPKGSILLADNLAMVFLGLPRLVAQGALCDLRRRRTPQLSPVCII